MKLRIPRNILIDYSLATLGITLLVTLAAGSLLSRAGKEQLIQSHLDLYPAIINHITHAESREIQGFFRGTQSDIPQAVEEHTEILMELSSIHTMKIWNAQGELIWTSAAPEKADPLEHSLDSLLEESLRGETVYHMDQPGDAEEEYLEIYLPLFREGRVIGAVEIYEKNRQLDADIHALRRLTWGITASAGLALYLLLFFIFFFSYQRQKRTTEQVKQTQDVTIYALAYQAGLRDEETGSHLKRTARYVSALAEELRRDKPYSRYIDKQYIEDLVKAAPLHDIGKVAIPDRILRKPGPLTPEEFRIITTHSELGARIIGEVLQELDFQSFLDMPIPLIRHHHEKWDGSGYPGGLRGDDIPLSARIMALADVYDALRTRRTYKEAFSHQKSLAIIRESSGTHFCPAVVEAFLQQEEEFRRISVELADPEDEPG